MAVADLAVHPIYPLIHARRDVRQFLHHPIPEDTLLRIWNFIVSREPAVKAKVKALFLAENLKAMRRFRGVRRHRYGQLKLEGIVEAPVNLCVTCDPHRTGPHVLGRNTNRRTDVYSQNDRLKRILGIPPGILPVAYLCLGYPVEFFSEPELALKGWARRRSLSRLIYFDQWGGRGAGRKQPDAVGA